MKTTVKLLAAGLLLAGAGSTLADVHYVDVNSTNAMPPYTNWSTAAINIDVAVDAAVVGDEIVVTNGTYGPLSVNKPLNIRSVNGPQLTIIDGGGWNRCATLSSGASLSGFTLTNGRAQYGGGLSCGSTAVVSNCVISGNLAVGYDFYGVPAAGGGAFGGTLNDCTLTDNLAQAPYYYDPGQDLQYVADAYGGGAAYCTLNNCTLTRNSARAPSVDIQPIWVNRVVADAYGGGAAYCTLNNCTLTGNLAGLPQLSDFGGHLFTYYYPHSSVYGGGAYRCALNNSILSNNHARGFYGSVCIVYDCQFGLCFCDAEFPYSIAGYGGGALNSTLTNCTLTGNGDEGASSSTLINCIIYFNDINYGSSTLSNCCTTPLPANGFGNITNAPLFVDYAGGNLRLQSNSPCINAGLNAFAPAGPDLDGHPRIVAGTADIGAYEFQSLDLVNFGVISNQFGFNVTGQSNWVIVLEASSDFTHWTPLTTNTLGAHPFPFSDPTPPNLPRRFYRARLQ